jgi:hypothetical protein
MVAAGLGIAVVGGLIWWLGRITGWKEFPGTIKIQGQGYSCIFPLLGSIILSIVLTVVLNLMIRLLNR